MAIEHFLLVAAVLLFLSIMAGKTGYRFGVPVLLLFLMIGTLAGSEVFSIISLDNFHVAQNIGVIALVCILFSGGIDTKYKEILPVARQGVMLATLGVLLTALITGVFIYFLTNWFFPNVTLTFLESLLLASVMSSTDSASVFALLRSKGLLLRHRLRPLLELESGSNDPMAYMLTITLISIIQQLQVSSEATIAWGNVALMFFAQLIIGAFLGFLLGKLAVRVINKINIDNDALYPILLLSSMLFVFSLTYFLMGNGFLAVYVAGLVMGNSKFVHKRTTLKFFDGLAWLFQIVMFLALGLLVNPSELLPIMGIGILVGVFMILFSRPAAVLISLLPFRNMTFNDRLYVSWIGLRGAVPIIFATYPMIAEIPHARTMFNIVFFITILSLMVQGTSVSWFARLLGLARPVTTKRRLDDFDVDFADEMKSSMMQITVTDAMLQNGHHLMNLPLHAKALVVMVKREDNYFIPKGSTELRTGDKLLLICEDNKILEETYKMLGAEVATKVEIEEED
ncbi:MAG: potassium/proton antiporter [Prevotellaceae bacterium]|jgi:cell volume regulation protein A|nr:potassium/proton antiporter [Prevotellaceae bacterium]